MTAPRHQCRVDRSPWAGVHCVRTDSERHFGRHWHDTFGIARVRERLADDPRVAPSLDELAALARLGKFQLLRRFTRAYGLPPHAWQLQLVAHDGRWRLVGRYRPGDTAVDLRPALEAP